MPYPSLLIMSANTRPFMVTYSKATFFLHVLVLASVSINTNEELIAGLAAFRRPFQWIMNLPNTFELPIHNKDPVS